jgi:hypothetical protein
LSLSSPLLPTIIIILSPLIGIAFSGHDSNICPRKLFVNFIAKLYVTLYFYAHSYPLFSESSHTQPLFKVNSDPNDYTDGALS